MPVGQNIKIYRTILGLTQKQLAKECLLSESAIKYYESNRRNPKIETLNKIANALGVSVNTLTNDESFDFEILFAATQLIWDLLPSNDDDILLLSKSANVDYDSLKDFQTKKISQLPSECRKGILTFISDKSPNEFNELYNNFVITNIYNLDDEIKNYCQQLYIKTMNAFDINNVDSIDELLSFITSHGYPAIKLNNETLKYLYEKVTDLLDFEFYKLEKNDFILPDDKKIE